jgi:hypothetical protein
MSEQASPVLCPTMNLAVDLSTDTERVVPTNKLRCVLPAGPAANGSRAACSKKV